MSLSPPIHSVADARLWWPRRPLATLDRKPRQGRKAATVSVDAGAEVSRRGHRHFHASHGNPKIRSSRCRRDGDSFASAVATARGSSQWKVLHCAGPGGVLPIPAASPRLLTKGALLQKVYVALSSRAQRGTCFCMFGRDATPRDARSKTPPWPAATVSVDAGAEVSRRGHSHFPAPGHNTPLAGVRLNLPDLYNRKLPNFKSISA
jgi:hypothetical protein